jgi:hypothetical protein
MRKILIALVFTLIAGVTNAYERSAEGDKQLIEIAVKELGYKPAGEVHITHEGKLIKVSFGAPIYNQGKSTLSLDGKPPYVILDPFAETPQVKEVYRGI